MAKPKSKAERRGPQFVRFFGPLLDALRELGGSGRPQEVTARVISGMNLSEDEQAATLKSGQSQLGNRIHWARFYLTKAGYLDDSERGVWNLTPMGVHASLDHGQAMEIFRETQARWGHKGAETLDETGDDEASGSHVTSAIAARDHREELLEILKALSPAGFERLCQRLLRETGFQQVNVTGRSGDGGIDGNGLLIINHLVSFKVLFQCKRYSGSVGASQVRDFRGAMQGRADKGMIITTGSYTRDATAESLRDGVPPIELIDGERLVELFENLELGLRPRRAFEVDEKFFDEYR